ncbi:hypothetical protein VaNZ11_014078 [Volvox africanus]|uniref:PLA2c domain-containing protein n=1 Tax=Volvox africanus TaxID=51714 RepID=A0ABQ5SHP2_9CHLO|nr:hypothetical protein VaNZ11_014078 [Volvox africanus]
MASGTYRDQTAESMKVEALTTGEPLGGGSSTIISVSEPTSKTEIGLMSSYVSIHADLPVDDTEPVTEDQLPMTIAVPASSGTISVRAWAPRPDGSLLFPEREDPKFAVPSLSDKAPLAVCIGGGGFRATTLALGWMRALHHMGLLDQVRYLSTISGSSWMGAALCFQKDAAAVADFLGPYLPPEECTPEALLNVGAKGKAYARAVADAVPLQTFMRATDPNVLKQVQAQLAPDAESGPQTPLLTAGQPLGSSTPHASPNISSDLRKEHCRSFRGNRVDGEQREVAMHWTCAMAEAFLEPFGLDDVNTSTVRVPGTKIAEEVSDRAAKVGRAAHIYDANVKDLPFLIIGQAVLLPKADAKFYPFEWTPLYGGCPVPYKDVTPKLGAGWVETLGLNAGLVAKRDSTYGSEVEVEVRPMGPASLGEATGISSAYHSLVVGDKMPNMLDGLRKPLGFHSTKYFDMQEWETHDVLLTDGGGYDLYGIYPALRRQVPNIMVFNCNGKPLDTLDAFSSDKDLPSLFGCTNDREFDTQRQVFKSECFNNLFRALRKKSRAGEAPVHVDDYEVLENKHMGIKGGWTARVMWVMNERMSRFEAMLPEAVRNQIPPPPTTEGELPEGFQAVSRMARALFEKATTKAYPYVDTFFMKYEPDLVSLMANHAAWMLVSNEKLVKTMFGMPMP